MAFITTGLTNGGLTAHYQFQYDDSLAAPKNPSGPEPARTNQVITSCEQDFNLMSSWFGNVPLGVNLPMPVNVTQNSGGAGWSKDKKGNANVTIKPGTQNQQWIRSLMVAEITEMFMDAQNIGWFGVHNEGTDGEGLSRFLRGQFFINIKSFGTNLSDSKSNLWLDSPRADYVNHPDPKDNGPDALTGCATLFIWYLSDQLGFDIKPIVAAGTSTLGGIYTNLTGDPDDPFPLFKQILDKAFPGKSTITAGNLDNPFPLPTAAVLSTLNYLRNDAPGTKFVRELVASKNVGGLRAVLNTDRRASLVA
jgi:hypothetical protein